MPLVVLIVDKGIGLLTLIILANALVSWVQVDPRNPIVRTLHAITEPILHPIRAILPPIGQMDFSPLVAILILSLLQKLIASAIYQ